MDMDMESFMGSFMQNMILCSLVAGQLRNYLKKNALLNFLGFTFEEQNNAGSFCFRVHLPPNADARRYGVCTVSVSVPMDAMGNRVDEDDVSLDNLPRTLELAMVDSQRELTYEHPDCDDVLRVFDFHGMLVLLMCCHYGFGAQNAVERLTAAVRS